MDSKIGKEMEEQRRPRQEMEGDLEGRMSQVNELSIKSWWECRGNDKQFWRELLYSEIAESVLQASF